MPSNPPPVPRAFPVGRCYCGCQAEIPASAFFAKGHDKRAESAVIREKYGNVANFLIHHGYGPDHPTAPGQG